MAKPFESRIEPWGEFVLVRAAPAPVSNIVMAETDPTTGKIKAVEKGKARRKAMGVVVAVGPGEWKFGVFVKTTIPVGAEVCFAAESTIRPGDMPELDEDLYFVPESSLIFRLKP